MELIVAMTDNFVIGAEWRNAVAFTSRLTSTFKALTSGSAIVMGRRTWESIGRPLPNRTNVVISRQRNYDAIGGTVIHSLEDAIRFAPEQRVFVIGGGEII